MAVCTREFEQGGGSHEFGFSTDENKQSPGNGKTNTVKTGLCNRLVFEEIEGKQNRSGYL